MHAGDGADDGQAQAVAFGARGTALARAEEAVEDAGQLGGGDGGAGVAHFHARAVGDGLAAQQDLVAGGGGLDGVGDQVGQRAAHQTGIGRDGRVAFAAQADAALFQRGVVVLGHAPGLGGQRDRGQVGGAFAAIGARQEQHVIDHGLQVFQHFQVGLQRVAQLGRIARRGQHDLGAVDQGGQRRAQLVRHVGVEAFHLLVGRLQAVQRAVEGTHEILQFAVGVL